MAVVFLCITLLMFAVQKYYLEAKTAATLTGKASRGSMLIEDRVSSPADHSLRSCRHLRHPHVPVRSHRRVLPDLGL